MTRLLCALAVLVTPVALASDPVTSLPESAGEHSPASLSMQIPRLRSAHGFDPHIVFVPDPSVDYYIVVVEPDPNVNYSMSYVPGPSIRP